MEAKPPRELGRGAAIGLWGGSFGWVVGLALVTLPELPRLLPELLGGSAVTCAVALGLRFTARNVPRFVPGFQGAVLSAIGVIALYYAFVVEPAVYAEPAVLERLQRLGSATHFPPLLAVGLLVVGAALLIFAWRSGERAASET